MLLLLLLFSLLLCVLVIFISGFCLYFPEMSLSEKSDEEISKLLAEYGIKHGPIVDSTRRLYEKKLESAMENVPANASPDKTYYREEEEEITYITYHTPVKHESYTNVVNRRGNVDPNEEEECDQDTEPAIQKASTTANHSAVQSRKQLTKSGGGLWTVIRLLLSLAILAALLYYIYCHMMHKENPTGVQ